MPSNYSTKRKQNLVPHFYDRQSRHFGYINPRDIHPSIVNQARDRAYQRQAASQSFRDQEIIRKVVRRG